MQRVVYNKLPGIPAQHCDPDGNAILVIHHTNGKETKYGRNNDGQCFDKNCHRVSAASLIDKIANLKFCWATEINKPDALPFTLFEADARS